ncbi:hypothetical protein LEP3755_57700 [Leptolyngbya sp. NIES-3755]|nr:hypothetical protein LEP3755_57700 [Leptolyngbya sp. NIES-3755]
MATQTINLKLVESLLQAIDALPPAEQNLVKSRLLDQNQSKPAKQSAIDILTALPTQSIFQTPEEVDQYIQEERNSWDS